MEVRLNHRLPWLGGLMLSLILSLPAAAAPPVPAAEWLPDGAVTVVHIEQPAAVLALVDDLHIPAPDSPDFRGFAQIFRAVAAQAGTDWRGLIGKLAGHGITYASYPINRTIIVLDGEDAAVLETVRQFVKPLAQRAFYQEYPGVTAFSLDGKLYFAISGTRLVAASSGDALKALFERPAAGGPALAASPLYRASRAALGDAPAISLFVNMTMLNQYPPARKALETSDNWLDTLLNGLAKQSLLESKWAAAALRIQGKHITLHAACDGKGDRARAAAFTAPGAGQGALPNLAVPHQIAGFTLWRDLGKFYAAKDTLFPEKTSGGILAENFLEIFFTGRDLGEEVFGRFHPEIRVVVAKQQYDPAIGRPEAQFPAAAVVFRAEHADEFGEVLEEAWQKAIGLQNFTRGQQALPGLIIDRTAHAGVPFTYCYYSARNEKDRNRLPSRFNLRPAIARVGPYIVLSTTDGLAKDVIDAVNKEDARVPAALSGAHTVLEILNVDDIAALLQANRTEMVRQSVVGKGVKPERAEKDFDTNLAWLERLESARLSLSETAAGELADLELRLK
jgi:hypothetical protein